MTVGVEKGDPLSSMLYNCVLDNALREADAEAGH